MKKVLLTLSFFFVMNLFSFISHAQTSLNESPNFAKYAKENAELDVLAPNEKRVVFIGNSITEGWAHSRPQFFKDNNYIGRGIGGQTSPQLLMRFQQDVINLHPVAVVINIGTNDIAKNTGDYNSQFTLDNIKSMAEIADANGIKVVLSSVLPVGEYPWRQEVKNVPQTIDALNAHIKAYADNKGFVYVDYNTPMRQPDGSMINGYANDGVHPTAAGYEVMEGIIKNILSTLLE